MRYFVLDKFDRRLLEVQKRFRENQHFHGQLLDYWQTEQPRREWMPSNKIYHWDRLDRD